MNGRRSIHAGQAHGVQRILDARSLSVALAIDPVRVIFIY